jgi:hypothetical protein
LAGAASGLGMTGSGKYLHIFAAFMLYFYRLSGFSALFF